MKCLTNAIKSHASGIDGRLNCVFDVIVDIQNPSDLPSVKNDVMLWICAEEFGKPQSRKPADTIRRETKGLI
jgi:hypothetical protein